jgi:hypothetical protein
MTSMDKYDVFFAGLSRFLIDAKLSSYDDIEGATESEILNFEHEHEISMNSALKSYSKFFGKRIRAKYIMGDGFFTFGSIIESYSSLDLYEDYVDGFKKALNVKKSSSIKDEILLLKHIENGSVFMFTHVGSDNPLISYHWVGGDNYVPKKTFIDTLRNSIFWGLFHEAGKGISTEVFGEITSFYFGLKSQNIGVIRYVRKWREEFMLKNRSKEEDGSMTGVYEFEIEFVEFVARKVDEIL